MMRFKFDHYVRNSLQIWLGTVSENIVAFISDSSKET